MPVVDVKDANSSEIMADESNVLSSLVESSSQRMQQKLANMDAAQLQQQSVLIDRTPMQLGSAPNGLPEDSTAQVAAVQQSMQGAASGAADAAGVALRNAQEVEQSFETMLADSTIRLPSYVDVQNALGGVIHADLGTDATNAFLGLVGSILALVVLMALQIQQRQKSETVCCHLSALCNYFNFTAYINTMALCRSLGFRLRPFRMSSRSWRTGSTIWTRPRFHWRFVAPF